MEDQERADFGRAVDAAVLKWLRETRAEYDRIMATIEDQLRPVVKDLRDAESILEILDVEAPPWERRSMPTVEVPPAVEEPEPTPVEAPIDWPPPEPAVEEPELKRPTPAAEEVTPPPPSEAVATPSPPPTPTKPPEPPEPEPSVQEPSPPPPPKTPTKGGDYFDSPRARISFTEARDAVRRLGEFTAPDLRDALGLSETSRSTVNNVLDGLTARGLVRDTGRKGRSRRDEESRRNGGAPASVYEFVKPDDPGAAHRVERMREQRTTPEREVIDRSYIDNSMAVGSRRGLRHPDSDLQQWMDQATSQGWTWERLANGHWRGVSPDERGRLSVSGSSVGDGTKQKLKHQFVRAGVRINLGHERNVPTNKEEGDAPS